MASMRSRKIAIVSLLVFQAVLVTLFSIFVKYDKSADPKTPSDQVNSTALDSQYPMFQDVHVMIFVGFGYLMTFLKRYAYSAVGFTFLISSVVVQWGFLCHGFFRIATEEHIPLSLKSLIDADIVAATVLISLGAVLGKVSTIQLLIMAILETVFFAGNEFLGTEIFDAVDAGGSMYVHTFGAYFGLAVSFVLARGASTETSDENNLESSTYQSDINAMFGTLFLWMFWPSFNAGLLSGDAKHRAIINTYMSLVASCVTTFAVSSMVNKNGKFDMVHIQNATLAGGVCVGTAANMMVQPHGALLIGSFAGILSTLGFRFVQGCLLKNLRIHDTCGVNNLHGMPGIAAGLIGAIMAGLADQGIYGLRMTEVFPAMGPSVGRTPGQQAGYQLLGLVVTFVIAVVGGLITGSLLRKMTERVKREECHRDDIWWETPELEERCQKTVEDE